MKLVRVEWDDATSMKSGWKTIKKVRKQRPEKCVSVGYIARRTKRYITLVASTVAKQCDGDVTIPVGWITKIKRLR